MAAAATKLGKTAVKGDDDWTEIVGETDALNWTEILGAVKPVGKPMGAKLTATKLKQMADQLTKAGKDLGTQATKFDTAYKASAKKIAAGVKVVAAKLDPRKSVSIKGIDELEATHSILGDFLGHALNNYEVLGQYYDRPQASTILRIRRLRPVRLIRRSILRPVFLIRRKAIAIRRPEEMPSRRFLVRRPIRHLMVSDRRRPLRLCSRPQRRFCG